MPRNNENIDIRLRIQGQQQVLSATREAGAGIKGLAAETRLANAEAGHATRGLGGFQRGVGGLRRSAGGAVSSLMGMAKGLVAAGAAFASYETVKRAVDTTEQLGIETRKLHAVTSLSIPAASQFAAVFSAYGIQAKPVIQTFGTLQKNIDAATHGSKATATAFQRLGFTTKDLGRDSKNMGGLLATLGDRFAKLKGTPAYAAEGMKLFGRGWQTVLPILSQGHKKLQDLLNTARESGASFSGSGSKGLAAYHEQQIKAKLAWEGFQVTLAQKVIPVLAKIIPVFSKVVMWISHMIRTAGHGRGVFKTIGKVLGTVGHAIGVAFQAAAKWVGGAVKVVVGFFNKNKQTFNDVATIFVFIGKTVAKVFMGVIVPVLNSLWGTFKRVWAAILTIVKGAVQIIKGIIQVFAGIIHGDFTKIWAGVKNIFKGAWHVLTGIVKSLLATITGWLRIAGTFIKSVFGGAWKWVKTAFSDGYHFVIKTFGDIVKFIVGLPGKIVTAAKGIFDGIKDAAKTVIKDALKLFNDFVGKVMDIFKKITDLPGKVTDAVGGALDSVNPFASGGVVPSRGFQLVGERGPEIVKLPGGTRVFSHETSRKMARESSGGPAKLIGDAVAAATGGETVVHSHVYIDGREIGHAVARTTQSQRARR